MPDPVKTMCAMHTLADAVPHHLDQYRDLVIHGRRVYRVTVERLDPDDASDAFNAFIEENDPWRS